MLMQRPTGKLSVAAWAVGTIGSSANTGRACRSRRQNFDEFLIIALSQFPCFEPNLDSATIASLVVSFRQVNCLNAMLWSLFVAARFIEHEV
jgi:hypothetical protein